MKKQKLRYVSLRSHTFKANHHEGSRPHHVANMIYHVDINDIVTVYYVISYTGIPHHSVAIYYNKTKIIFDKK